MADSAPSSDLVVDLLLADYRLAGSICLPVDAGRVGDYLSSRSETICLKQASIMDLGGQTMLTVLELAVEKRSVIAAIPRESEDFLQRQRLVRLGMVTRSLVHVPVLALIPPYAASGTIHIAPSTELSDAERLGLERFFPLTDACLYLRRDRLYQGGVIIVNREMLAALGKTRPDA